MPLEPPIILPFQQLFQSSSAARILPQLFHQGNPPFTDVCVCVPDMTNSFMVKSIRFSFVVVVGIVSFAFSKL